MADGVKMRGIASVIGAFMVSLGVGYMYLWGIITIYATSYFRIASNNQSLTQESTDITFPLIFLGQAISMPIAARFAQKTSPRTNCMIAGAVFASLLYMASYTTNFPTFAGLFGLCCGVVVGVIYIIPIVHCFRFFPDYKSLISIIVIGASGIGTLIFAFLATNTINPDNAKLEQHDNYFNRQISQRFPLYLRTLSGLIFLFVCGGGLLLFEYPQGVVLTSATKRKRKQKKDEGRISNLMNMQFALVQEQTAEQPKNPFGTMNYQMNFIHKGETSGGRYNAENQELDFWPSINERQSSTYQAPDVYDEKSDTDKQTKTPNNLTIDINQCPRVRDAPKQKIFWVIFFCIAFGTNFNLLVNGNYKTFAKKQIANDYYLTTIGAVAAVACGFSRFFWGYILQRVPVKVLLGFLLIVNSVFSFTIIYVVNIKQFYFIYIVGAFIIYGGNLGIYPVITSKIFGVRYSGQIYGLLFYGYTLSNFLQFILINLVESHFGFFVVFSLSGGMSILAAFIIYRLDDSHDWSVRIRQHNERKRIQAR